MIGPLIDLLACPQCGGAMQLEDRSVGCAEGHRFDLARQGYLNLLRSAPPKNADTPVMVAARDRFLQAGHYKPFADAICSVLGNPGSILEAGAGTGYYLAAGLDALPEARGLALDVSVPACKRAARAHPRLGAVVADTWQQLPVRDYSIDVIMAVFAPRNVAEFARVLATGGRLLIVAPNQDHLIELRQSLGLLQIKEDKQERLLESLADSFHVKEVREVRADLLLDREAVSDLIMMGPNAFHTTLDLLAAKLADLPKITPVTGSVWIVEASPKLRPPG